jgi:hypothetical protein
VLVRGCRVLVVRSEEGLMGSAATRARMLNRNRKMAEVFIVALLCLS